MRNYFKVTRGSSRSKVVAEYAFFDDTNATQAVGSLRYAREALGPRGVVSVWKRSATVPSYIPEIGEPPVEEEAAEAAE